jgi:hypothetical protein
MERTAAHPGRAGAIAVRSSGLACVGVSCDYEGRGFHGSPSVKASVAGFAALPSRKASQGRPSRAERHRAIAS